MPIGIATPNNDEPYHDWTTDPKAVNAYIDAHFTPAERAWAFIWRIVGFIIKVLFIIGLICLAFYLAAKTIGA